MLDHGNTSWLLISSALVLLMTPGVAFFYSGLVSTRNVINTINMSFICLGVIPIVWVLLGFNLAFSPNHKLFGGLSYIGLLHLDIHIDAVHETTQVPKYAFMIFQMMFAVLAPALISGAIVGRMKFKPYVCFIILWNLFVYTPIAHWVWAADGWIAELGAIDFAGGTVVHISSGFAALVAAIILGPRLKQGEVSHNVAHSIPFVVLGASLLWFGWYGFNAGSALSANAIASLAFLNTTLAASASICIWMVLCWTNKHPSSAIGKSVSAIIGLVAVTPAAGYVTPISAVLIGCVSSFICYFMMDNRNKLLNDIDDTLDVFICHGVSGVIGALMTGLLATKTVNPDAVDGLFYGNPSLLLNQFIAVVASIVMTVVVTALIFFILKSMMDIRPTPKDEKTGIDASEHGEKAYRNIT